MKKRLSSSGNNVFHQENHGYIHGFANMGYIPGVSQVLNEICSNLKEMMKWGLFLYFYCQYLSLAWVQLWWLKKIKTWKKSLISSLITEIKSN